MARRATSSPCAALSRSKRIAPKTRGVRVLTRPPRISGAPDHVAIGVTAMPLSARWFAVPPVERISTPRAVRARARSTMPVLSETDRIARSTFRIQDDAARLAPDVREEVRRVGDGVGVADRGDAEGGGAVVERRRIAARVLLRDKQLERRGARDDVLDEGADAEMGSGSVVDGGKLGDARLEVVREVGAGVGRVRVGDEMCDNAEPLDDGAHRLVGLEHLDGAARLVVDTLAQHAVMPFLGQRLLDAARVVAVEVL